VELFPRRLLFCPRFCAGAIPFPCITGTRCTIPRIVICLSRIALETAWRLFPRWMRQELARRTSPEPVALIFRPTAKSSGSAPSRTDRRDRCRQPTARQYFSMEWDHSLFQYRFRPAPRSDRSRRVGKLLVRLRQANAAESLLALFDPSSNSLADLTSLAPQAFQNGVGVTARSADHAPVLVASHDNSGTAMVLDRSGAVSIAVKSIGSGASLGAACCAPTGILLFELRNTRSF
jgi:hypothetical protein